MVVLYNREGKKVKSCKICNSYDMKILSSSFEEKNCQFSMLFCNRCSNIVKFFNKNGMFIEDTFSGKIGGIY